MDTVEDLHICPTCGNTLVSGSAYQGSNYAQPLPGVMLGCISPEAGDLLQTILTEWEKFEAGLKAGSENYQPGVYSFAYWLCRYSGLVKPVHCH